jgi:hypothetical protein
MAIYTAGTTYLLLGSLNISDHVTSADLNINYNMISAKAMVASGSVVGNPMVKGSANHTLTATLFNDQAVSNIRSVLDGAKGSTLAFAIAANGSTPTTANPVYSGNVYVNDYAPVGGELNTAATVDFTFDVAGDIVITTA